MRKLLPLILLAATAFAQQGQVFATQQQAEQARFHGAITDAIPLPVPGGKSIDFDIIQDVQGSSPGYFAFDSIWKGKTFALSYLGNYGCEQGCSFYGTVTKHWKPLPQHDGCVMYGADISGDFGMNGQNFSGITGFYHQELCGTAGAYRWAGGDISFYVTQ